MMIVEHVRRTYNGNEDEINPVRASVPRESGDGDGLKEKENV